MLKSRIGASETISFKLTRVLKTGYMIKSEFENDLGDMSTKLFPNEETAKAGAHGQEIIKVEIVRKSD